MVDAAADVGAGRVRSLDAIHLASALSIAAELAGFVACDHRLAAAATAAGLVAIAPGA